jgi:hypothetical protein
VSAPEQGVPGETPPPGQPAAPRGPRLGQPAPGVPTPGGPTPGVPPAGVPTPVLPTPVPPRPPRPPQQPEPIDPRTGIEELSTDSPLVLLPVRIETRFADVGSAERPQHQLWVRIYPDDCSIDTFEETLSDVEVANAKLYWQGIWRAGGVEADERAAWRSLVAAHGSGRAGYILDTYKPTNLAEKPLKANPSDELLMIGTQAPLPAGEAAAIGAYWQAIWVAGEDVAEREAAEQALTSAVGAPRAQTLRSEYAPFNLADAPTAPATRASVASSTAFVVFGPDPPAKQWSWSQAPKVEQLPERFVVLGYSGETQTLEAVGGPVKTPLHVGPDPSVEPHETIHPEGEELFVPEELRWLVDFQAAVEVGMGIAIDIEAEQARAGFDRLLVFGVQLGASAEEGRQALEELLRHHHTGLGGLEILAQGTPTHNTTGKSSGYGRGDDSDSEASFDDRSAMPLFTPTTEPLGKRDGQVLAEALGIDPAILQGVHGADGEDQLRARAMQRALWPATGGYWMDKMLAPMFGDEMVAQARWFFANHVRGRGAVPALRIGGQPYGVLPTTAFSRISWLSEQREPRQLPAQLSAVDARPFMAGLLALLREIDGDWEKMAEGAAYVGKPGDAHQMLLDIVGLQSGSVEYRWRYSESLTEIYNIINLWGLGPEFWQALMTLALQASGEELLARLGYSGAMPQILEHAFLNDSGVIDSLIDDRPLSETEPIRAYTQDGHNYVTWLIDAAGASLDALREEQGFSGGRSPQMLLYLYLRQALLLGYYDASYELHRSAGFLSAAELAAMKPEPNFIHVQEGAAASESRYSALYKTESRITGSPTVLVADYITQHLETLPQAAGLAEQLQALSALEHAPTAQLERLLAEHVDTCSYRFDAWLLGLVNVQLEAMRAAPGPGGLREGTPEGEQPPPQGGVYLGAYAWVEDLRPSEGRLEPVRLSSELEPAFGAGASSLQHDPSNGGYLLAPSLTHARTAAVLRSGYLANATPQNPETMAVNLSSDRVRVALSLLEGIRGGQSLGALLGYSFERGLHDDYGLAEVDKFIYPLRKAFPLVANSLASTSEPDVSIEALEASNVLDGRKLANKIRESGQESYPFGVAELPAASVAEREAIDAQANALLNALDAVGDLALAEGVHQAAQGNFERIGATLDAYSSGAFPPDPEVVQTPTAGTGLTQRVALQLTPGLSAPAGATPRAQAEPALDAWLGEMLPELDQVGCSVTWTDPVGGAPQSRTVTLADLGLRPLDVLELVRPDDVQAMSELDDRILGHVLGVANPRPDAALEIHYRSAPAAGKLSVFEVSALVQSLRTLVQGARPLRATDALPPSEATPEHDGAVFADRSRVAEPKAQLDLLAADLSGFISTLQPLLADPQANRATLLANVDVHLDETVALLARAASFGIPQSGWGFVYGWRRAALHDLLALLTETIAGWDDRLSRFDALVAAYDALPTSTSEVDRFSALQAAEMLVVRVLEPLPAEPALLRKALDGMRTALAAVRASYQAAASAPYSSFHEALGAVQGLPSIAAYDTASLDLAPFEERALEVSAQIEDSLSGHLATIAARRQATQTQLEAHDAAGGAQAQVQALQEAAKALLGESFTLIPEFLPGSTQGSSWAAAVGAFSSGEPFKHLTETLKIERPVQEWLSGAARVRASLRNWETSAMLAAVLGGSEPAILPIQLPFQAGEPWLAMQLPEGFTLEGERLLYTAHYATPFAAGAHQCGLLLDEWTEVIPSTTKEAGVTFNFDRPDNEPPQAILVVTPASVGAPSSSGGEVGVRVPVAADGGGGARRETGAVSTASTGGWQWEDLVGALNETLDLAKKRALEPAQIEPTPYARLLPATIMAVTLYGISISTALAVADGVLQAEEVARRA